VEKILNVRRVGLIARIADMVMVPIMYLLSGSLREKPQKTHAWNVQNLHPVEIERLDIGAMVLCKGIDKQPTRRGWLDFLPFMPIIGGWRNYVVLQPEHEKVWHVGWETSDLDAQISILPIVGPIRVLVGPGDVSFFGVTDDGIQTPISEIDKGRIGDHGEFSKVPLC
jgi:hypothetical protein